MLNILKILLLLILLRILYYQEELYEKKNIIIKKNILDLEKDDIIDIIKEEVGKKLNL